jgi:hypothetical protein
MKQADAPPRSVPGRQGEALAGMSLGAGPKPLPVLFLVDGSFISGRVFAYEHLRKGWLRRVDDVPRELRPIVAHRRQFGHRQRVDNLKVKFNLYGDSPGGIRAGA